MNKASLVTLAIAFCFFGDASGAPAGGPPMIPGKVYIRTADGCGIQLKESSSLTPEVLKLLGEDYWLGDCKHGLANGLGYIFPSSPLLDAITMTYMQFGEDMRLRASVSPSAGPMMSLNTGPKFNYQIFTEDYQSSTSTSVPVNWDMRQPYELPNFDEKSSDDLNSTPTLGLLGRALVGDKTKGEVARGSWQFSLHELPSSRDQQRFLTFSIDKRSCLLADKKIRGCHYTNDRFDVFGVLVTTITGEKSQDLFTMCPEPKTIAGCGEVWRKVVSPHLDSIVALVKQTESAMATEQESLAKQSSAAEAALPSDWKQYWRSNTVDRSSAVAALKCAEASDFSPASLDNAFFIKQKYAQAPCHSAVTTGFIIDRANKYIRLDSQEKNDQAAQREAEARARARRDQANQEAWAGFFNNASAMLNTQIQIQQQRIDNTNAQIAASNQQAAAPAYQSYGQPLVASSGQQSYDPSKVQTRAIHKPEWDALQCVKLNQTGRDDSVLTGTGSQYFLNACDKAIEVFWCKVGGECERGSGNSWKIHPQNTWPLSAGQYHYGACISGSSGGFVKDSSGKITGRYACTGP